MAVIIMRMRFFTRALRSLRHVMHAVWGSARNRLLLLSTPVLIALAAVAVNYDTIAEDIMFRYDHTAGRACRYGTKHLSSNEPRHYDFERARYFLEACRDLDPTWPGVNYHLSRVYFIQRQPIRALMSANAELRLSSTTPEIPQIYYMKGLIEGMIGHYDTAAEDYKAFLSLQPDGFNGWAGYNDYAWVLLKGERAEEALAAIKTGLGKYPDNAWLLTIQTTALYELGRLEEAAEVGARAVVAADALTKEEWRSAYPGNDPRTTADGLATIRRSTRENLEKIRAELAAKAQ